MNHRCLCYSTPSRPEAPPLSPVLRDVAIIVGAYLYFTGWLYAYYFFEGFGVALNIVDIPVYYFFIYSYNVLMSFWGVVVVVAAGIAAIVTAQYGPRWAVAAMLVLAFPSLFYVARNQATVDARGARLKDARRIVFQLKNEESFPAAFRNHNDGLELKLLVQTKERYLVFRQSTEDRRSGIPHDDLPIGYTYDVRKEDVSLATIRLRGEVE